LFLEAFREACGCAGPSVPATVLGAQAVKTRSNGAALMAAGCTVVLSWIILAGTPADAAGFSVRPTSAAAAMNAAPASKGSGAGAKVPETTSSVSTSADLEPTCLRSRKRLWIDGEGWVVRRVTTCF
jgi:hypothetical protein